MLTCPHFGTCGGCTLLTTGISDQREAKATAVAKMLAPHLGDLEPTWTDDGARTPRHDRMRILYPVHPDPRHGLTMGLYQRGTHDPIELTSCEIQHPALTELGRRALSIFRRLALSPYDEVRHQGLLRAFGARLSATTGELLMGVVTTTDHFPAADRVADALMRAAADLPSPADQPIHPVGVVHNVNPRRGNALLGPTSRDLTGRGHIIERVDGLSFRIGFASFYQLHRHSQELLYGPALELVDPVAGLRVVDGYGGIGTFALRLARRGVAAVTIVESSASACADARHNISTNELPAVDVVMGSFDDVALPPAPDLLLVDPSRAGLGKGGRDQLRRLGAPRILYVACGLAALARDLNHLPEYRLADLQLADLFPHTEHVEVLALMRAR